jgi:hypothetical protein
MTQILETVPLSLRLHALHPHTLYLYATHLVQICIARLFQKRYVLHVFRPGLVITDLGGEEFSVVLEDDGVTVGLVRYSRKGEEWEPADCTLGRFPTGIPEVDEGDWREITPDSLRRLADNWDAVLNLTKAWLVNDRAEENRILRALERRGRRGGRGVGTDFYKAIAIEYRRLLRQGARPTTTIARTHGVSRTTASRWVKRARELAFLGPALPRRAGEGDPDESI